MATGDLKNNLKQFQSQVKAIKYPSSLDLEGLKNGSPKAYLPLYHYVFTTYSNKFNKDIVNSNNELYGKSDLRFMEAVYKIMRVMFSHKPGITREQFFVTGFTERKLIMATDIFRIIHSHYKPHKSGSGYKLATHVERPTLETAGLVQQEVSEPSKPRKIASRSPNFSGAVVLPRSFSGSSLMKSSHKAPVQFSATELSLSNSDTATPRSESSEISTRVHRVQHGQEPNGFPDMTPEMTKKMADQLTHSVIFLNEKIGKMALAIQNQEQRIESSLGSKPEPVEQAPLSNNTLATNLSKQMNAIMFKMDTLSSRVVLLENRMMMMEAKVDDTQSLCRTAIATRNRPLNESHSLLPSESQRNSALSNARTDSRRADVWQQKEPMTITSQQNRANSVHQVVREFAPEERQKPREEVPHQTMTNKSNRNEVEDQEQDDDEDNDDNNIIEVIGVEKEDVAAPSQNMAFMKSLVDPDNTATSNLTSNDCTLTTTQVELVDEPTQSEDTLIAQRLQSHGFSTDKGNAESTSDAAARGLGDHERLADSFGNFFSPIRSFCDTSADQCANNGFEDSSAIGIPCALKDDDDDDNRRFSTPNKASLDTSTLSRVSRITQLLTETEMLFK